MVTVTNTFLPKLCHARPGDIVQVCDDSGEPTDQLYVVCVYFKQNDSEEVKKPPKSMNGLYSYREPLFLVNMRNGVARTMPHLSSRVVIIRDAQLVCPSLLI